MSTSAGFEAVKKLSLLVGLGGSAPNQNDLMLIVAILENYKGACRR